MNLTELRTFLCVVETGSLIRASQELNVTQSTVTARLKALEDEIGQVLITRRRSGAVLTGAGVRLKRYAETISDLWQQARQEAALPGALQATCNIGCHPDLWQERGKRFFDFIRTRHEDVAISVWYGGQRELTDWLNAGLTDLSLTYWPAATQTQTLTEIAADTLILVGTEPERPTKFDPGYIFIEAGEAFGRDHAAAYADAGTARISFGAAGPGLEHILEHGGSAYLPDRLAAPGIASGKLFRLKDAPDFRRRAYVVANTAAAGKWSWFAEGVDQLNGAEVSGLPR